VWRESVSVSVYGKENENEGECFSFECFREGVFTLEGECGGKNLFINI